MQYVVIALPTQRPLLRQGPAVKSVPGADSYIQAAADKLGPAKIADRAGLNSALTRLGMTPKQVNKFVPAVTDYVAKQGGDYTKNLLLGAMR